MNKEKLQTLANELAKDLKTPEDLANLSSILTKLTVETALKAELDFHLGYQKHAPNAQTDGNSRNGYSTNRLKGNHGDIEIDLPRDRHSTFEPSLVKKRQSRITGMDDQILCLYAKGMSTRDIVATFKEMYDADISAGLVSQVTNAVIDRV